MVAQATGNGLDTNRCELKVSTFSTLYTYIRYSLWAANLTPWQLTMRGDVEREREGPRLRLGRLLAKKLHAARGERCHAVHVVES